MSEQPRVCKCGCGAVLKRNKKGRMPTWVKGHNGRGKPPHSNTIAASIARCKGKPPHPNTIAALKGKPPHSNTIAASIARCKGKHGFGRMARDNPSHHEAKHWIIRDNRGVIHECDNLTSWCRANEWRFLPDMRPESRTLMWERAMKGISQLGQASGKLCSWHGWTLVSVVERQEQGAPDLMDREAV